MRRPSVDPSFTFALSLVLSLVLCYPTFSNMMHARIDVTEGAIPPPDNPERVVDAAVKFVAKTEAPLSLIPLEDLVGQKQQPNLPGTVTEHPNWRRRFSVEAATLLEQEPVARRVEAVAAERPRQ